MPGCAIYGCSNYNRKTKGTDIRYFRFPKDDHLCKLWLIACRREDEINLNNACICSIHFEKDCFTDISVRQKLSEFSDKNIRNLKDDAIPTLKLPIKREIESNSETEEHIKQRQLVSVYLTEADPSTSQIFEDETEITQCQITLNPASVSNKQELLQLQIKVAMLQKENNFLVKENNALKAELDKVRTTLLSEKQIKRIKYSKGTNSQQRK